MEQGGIDASTRTAACPTTTPTPPATPRRTSSGSASASASRPARAPSARTTTPPPRRISGSSSTSSRRTTVYRICCGTSRPGASSGSRWRRSTVTNMCIRCLERLYALHAHTIGVSHDVMILVRSMALTTSAEIQHRILSLLATLLGVAGEDDGGEEDDGRVRPPDTAEQLLTPRASRYCDRTSRTRTRPGQPTAPSRSSQTARATGPSPPAPGTPAPPPPSPTRTRGRRSIQYRRMRGQLPVGPQSPDRTCALGPCAYISPSAWGCSLRRLTGPSRSCRRRCATHSPGLLCRHYVEQAAL